MCKTVNTQGLACLLVIQEVDYKQISNIKNIHRNLHTAKSGISQTKKSRKQGENFQFAEPKHFIKFNHEANVFLSVENYSIEREEKTVFSVVKNTRFDANHKY